MSLIRTLAGVVAMLGVAGAEAAEVTVKTLNSGPGGAMVFDPAFVTLKAGDTIRFVPQDKGHNAETIKGMAPEGAETIKTTVGQEATLTFAKEGVYGFKCSPHYLMGMVFLAVVGDTRDNLEAARAVQHGKLAQKRFDPLFARVQ